MRAIRILTVTNCASKALIINGAKFLEQTQRRPYSRASLVTSEVDRYLPNESAPFSFKSHLQCNNHFIFADKLSERQARRQTEGNKSLQHTT